MQKIARIEDSNDENLRRHYTAAANSPQTHEVPHRNAGPVRSLLLQRAHGAALDTLPAVDALFLVDRRRLDALLLQRIHRAGLDGRAAVVLWTTPSFYFHGHTMFLPAASQ